ncbi:uncharacterized protein [Prorops nasuta]|uniref:uncharacterized protein n=1 Tax=Prorops nasuta TaxID=863751 RepID=UPI0034CF035F
MYTCPSCEQCFSSIKLHIAHLKHLIRKHNESDKIVVYKKNTVLSEDTLFMTNKNVQTNMIDNLSNQSLQKLTDCTPLTFIANLEVSVSNFISKLCNYNSLNRKMVIEIVKEVDKLYSANILEYLQKCVTANIIDEKYNFKTEHKVIKYLQERRHFIKPRPIYVESSLQPRNINGETEMRIASSIIQVMPLHEILKKFLELPNVFKSIKQYIENVKNSDILVSSMQGALWKKIEQRFEGKTVLPLIIYFDDLEINNPLGSHRSVNKLGVVYCTLGCLPTAYSSLLENIFTLQIHKTKDHCKIGNQRTFANVIDEIISLETKGLVITVDNTEYKLYFSLLSIIGDNLGIHDICGFNKSFKSSYSCRACLVDSEQLFTLTYEKVEILRNVENYTSHAFSRSHGIKEECCFNRIPSFHVISNLTFDIMHDLYEGICRYELGQILNGLLNIDKLFTLETLNSRVRYFNYGIKINLPPPLTADSIKKQYIIYSASEMQSIIKYLSLIIGDLIPENKKFWKLYILLRKMICLIMRNFVAEEDLIELSLIIKEHHALYIQLFEAKLKPKHHYLLHYPNVIRRLGPLIYFSSMRFEAKHKELKTYSKIIASRVNAPYTLAFKQQLKLSHRFSSGYGFGDRINS